MQVLASQLPFLANRNAEQAVPPLFWPVNCIKIGRHVALLSGPSVYVYSVIIRLVITSQHNCKNAITIYKLHFKMLSRGHQNTNVTFFRLLMTAQGHQANRTEFNDVCFNCGYKRLWSRECPARYASRSGGFRKDWGNQATTSEQGNSIRK